MCEREREKEREDFSKDNWPHTPGQGEQSRLWLL